MDVPLMPETRATILRSNYAPSQWNFSGGPALLTMACDARSGRATAIDHAGQSVGTWDDPFEALNWMESYDLSNRPAARWIGFISYEFTRRIERLPATTPDDLAIGEHFRFALHEPTRSDESARGYARDDTLDRATFEHRSLAPRQYIAVVRSALDYIAAGDVFQVNLAQRFSFRSGRPARAIFERLTRDSPSPYGAILELDGRTVIVSNSPELFFRIEPQRGGSRKIVNRPIKGTRPNAPGMFDELSHSAKDRAELAMIVDLQRNDLGRVCEIGSVVVTEPRVIEATPTVYHGVATIEGSLRKDANFADVIRALFPCGSITGCPKIRAMEIIDELEPVARGPYCGAIGYLAADGSAEFNVAIRTMVIKDGIAHVYVGSGIVADSSPEGEYEETLVKAKAMLDALGAPPLSS
jgi:anthranilate/para-aminobenzoate synthase component I